MRVGVRERPETVVVFLAGGIPQRELDVLAINLHVGDVVLEDGRHIDLGSAHPYARQFWRKTSDSLDAPQGTSLSKTQSTDTSGKEVNGANDDDPSATPTFPQAPSPTITSFLRISAMARV